MKKTLTIIVLLLTLVLLTGRFSKKEKATTEVTTTQNEKNPLDVFINAINETKNAEIYGIEYEKVQNYQNTVVYKNTVNSQVVSYEDNKAKVYYCEKELADFPSDNQFNIIEYTKVYNGTKVTKIENDETTTINESLTKLKITLNLQQLLNENNISNYQINDNSISVNVGNDSITNVYNIDGVNDLSFTLVVEDGKISEINMAYKINDSSFTLNYKYTYSAFDSSILN